MTRPLHVVVSSHGPDAGPQGVRKPLIPGDEITSRRWLKANDATFPPLVLLLGIAIVAVLVLPVAMVALAVHEICGRYARRDLAALEQRARAPAVMRWKRKAVADGTIHRRAGGATSRRLASAPFGKELDGCRGSVDFGKTGLRKDAAAVSL